MTDNVVLIRYDENPSKCYEEVSKLRDLAYDDKGLEVESAAVIARDESGQLTLDDGTGREGGSGVLSGSLIGMAVGALAGPVGLLMGWATGALAGSVDDADRESDAAGVLDMISEQIQPGQTAVIAHVDEKDTSVLDQQVADSGGTLERWSAYDLVNDLHAAEDVAATEAKEARKEYREQRREERKDKIEATLDKVKSKL